MVGRCGDTEALRFQALQRAILRGRGTPRWRLRWLLAVYRDMLIRPFVLIGENTMIAQDLQTIVAACSTLVEAIFALIRVIEAIVKSFQDAPPQIPASTPVKLK